MKKTKKSAPKMRTKTVTLSLPISALCIDSNHEPVTQACFDYREAKVYPYLEVKGLQLVRCQGGLARRHYVSIEAVKPSVHYITGVGHGTADTFTGDYFDPVYSCGNYNGEEVRNKITHFISCQTAQLLGPDFIKNGCEAYFGYDADFALQLDEVEIFMYCDSEIDRALADGATAAEVYDRVISVFNNYINEFRRLGQNYKAATLEYNRDHLRCPSIGSQWGKTEARL